MDWEVRWFMDIDDELSDEDLAAVAGGQEKGGGMGGANSATFSTSQTGGFQNANEQNNQNSGSFEFER